MGCVDLDTTEDLVLLSHNFVFSCDCTRALDSSALADFRWVSDLMFLTSSIPRAPSFAEATACDPRFGFPKPEGVESDGAELGPCE